jgi:predicted NBD/HSP70 family sugar kinase
MAGNVLAIDVGGSKIAYAIVDPEGKILESDRIHVDVWEAIEVVRQVKFLIKSFSPKVKAVGVGFPGVVNTENGEIIYDEKSQKYDLSWNGIELPIAFDNDANLAALGERWLGSTQNVNNFVFIILGDGVGSGVYLEGHLYRGSHYASGQICDVITTNKTLDSISGYNFPGEFDADDKSTLSFICEQLSEGIQSISAVVDPTTIILGGTRGIEIWPLIEEELREKVKHLNILIQPSALGADASLIGAARMALNLLEKKPAEVVK